MQLTQAIKNRFKGWNKFEIGILLCNILVALAILIYSCANGGYDKWPTWVAFVSNVFNIISVILATKKKVICFVWGILAVIGFGAVSFYNSAIGNTLLYWAFYIPAQLLALYLWRKNSANKIDVQPTNIQWCVVLLTIVLGGSLIALFSWVETLSSFQSFWNNLQPDAQRPWLGHCILDATILILSIAMTIYTWLRFRQRWYLSVIIDSCQIAFWSIVLAENINNPKGDIGSSCIMIVSSVTMLACAIYGVINWKK